MKSGMVQIVIKAPNQMIDDQTIECDRLWTVRQLKEHLFKEYPTHPNPENQKLIYSGKLLSDNMPLSDVLKTYAGHEYNTIHLVCSVRETSKSGKIVSTSLQSPTPTPTPSFSELPQPTSSTLNDNSNNNTDDGGILRREINAVRCTLGHVPGNGISYNYSQQDVAQQILLIQQAYIQYMSHYIHMANNGHYRLDNHPNEPPQTEQTNREVPQNQVEAEVEDDAGAQRDWLEWIYIMTRVVVLFSVVYFYSSPLRFIVVMSMALLLFNMDVERWRRRQDETPPAGQVRPNGSGSTDWQQGDQRPLEVHHPHPLHVFSTFITSFFLSLIPEQRAM